MSLSTKNDLASIKNLTRLALPDDDSYILRLGVALYGFASINSFMCEIISHLNKDYNHTILQEKESSKILGIFYKELEGLKESGKYPEIHQKMKDAADLFETLNSQRNDIIHAYPITSLNGAQILHRRKDSKNKYFEVTNSFIDTFISKLHEVCSGLYVIRDAAWSKK